MTLSALPGVLLPACARKAPRLESVVTPFPRQPPASASAAPEPSSEPAASAAEAPDEFDDPEEPPRRAHCGDDRTGDRNPWVILPPEHPAYPMVRKVARAFATREVSALAASTGLPLGVRYPDRYENDGRDPVWELDVKAKGPAARARALELLLAHFPVLSPEDREADHAAQLGESPFIDMDPSAPKSTVRARVCVDYAHVGDGGQDELELTLVRQADRRWVVHQIDVGRFMLL